MANTISRREALGAAVALVSMPEVASSGELKTVTDRISDFLAARRDLDVAVAIDDDAAFELPVWSAFIETERALISHPCANDEDRRMKISFALFDPYFFDTIDTNTRDGRPVLVDFLRSLI